MEDELMIVSGLDQYLPVDSQDALNWIEDIIDVSLKEHNSSIALNAIKGLVMASKMTGLTLAKGLYLMRAHWKDYGREDDFEELIFTETGLTKFTIDRYLSVWGLRESNIIPADLQERIMQRNIKDIVPIASAIDQGFKIDEDTWEELSMAPDYSSVSAIIRDVKGRPPRAGSLQLTMDKLGTIWATMNNERYFVGSLEVDSEDEPVQKAIERLLKSAGVMST